MKKRILVFILFFIVIVFLGGVIIINNIENNREILEEKESMVTLQKEYEKEIVTDGYTIDKANVILDPYHNSPLTALILFETENEVKPLVTVQGRDDKVTLTHEFNQGTKHYLTVYGLYPDYENKVTVSYDDNGKNISKEYMIKTDKLPGDFILPTKVEADKDKLSNDLYFYTPSSKGYTCAYDINGDVRWYLTSNAVWDNKLLKNGRMLISTERLINTPYYMTGLYEIDMLGKIYREYSLKGGYHHDYFEMPNGNLLVASDDFNNPSGTVEDYIVEVDRETGDTVKTFDLKDVLKMEDGKSENWIEYDWFHNNSVWYDEKTNSIVLSGRHQDAVINISYETGKLNWIIGDSTNWSSEYQKYFFKPTSGEFEWQWSQHAAMVTPEGYIFLFDNGNNKSKDKSKYVPASNSYSRGVMYKINTDEMTIEQVFEYGKKRGSSFYSPYISDVDYLAKDNYIIHSGGIVYVDGENSNQPAGFSKNAKLVSDTVELLNNKVIFELVLPTNNYRAEKINIYDTATFSLGEAKRLGSLGTTAITTKKKVLTLNSKKIDEEYKKHKIEFVKEEDRLVFQGKFKKGTKVNVLLYKDFNVNYYNIAISKHPYTALCVDIFNSDEEKNGLTINSYINKDGLNGKYLIYLEIDGVVYDTEQSVLF